MERIKNDVPLTDIKDDSFKREPLVDLIVESINNVSRESHPCVVYGIYGKWGEGKTTLLNFIEDKLISQGKTDNISIVHFNPWIVSNEEALLREFFNSTVVDVDEKVRNLFKRYGSLVVFAARTFANIFIPNSGDRIAEGVKDIKDTFTGSENSITQLKKATSDAIVKSGKHLLIIIDDVDRLDKDEIHAVLRLVRQVADFDNCIYMLAMDVDMVAKSISDYYGDGTVQDGRRFIDKIVQVPITIPKIPRVDFDKIIAAELNSILEGYCLPEDIASILEDVCPLIDTKRDLIRYCNQISFVLPGLKGEVNIHDLCLLEAIKMVSNDVYEGIYSHRAALMKTPDLSSLYIDQDKEEKYAEERYNDAIDNIVVEFSSPKKELIRNAIDNLFTSTSINYQHEVNQKRLCTSIYFNKYFAQTVPSNLIPDTDLNSVYNDIDKLSVEQTKAWLDSKHEVFGTSEIERGILYFLEKVEDNSKEAEIASKLSKALAISDITKNYPPNPYHNIGTNIASFLAYNVIPRYFFNIEKSSGERVITDNDIFNDTFSFIFNNAEMNFCFSLVFCLKDQISLHRHLKQETVHILTERFSEEPFDVQFGRAKGFLMELFSLWKTTDEQSFNSYADSLFENEDIPFRRVLSRLITETDYIKDGNAFFNLFKNQCPIIKKRIEEDASEENEEYAVKVFIGNYNTFVNVPQQG